MGLFKWLVRYKYKWAQIDTGAVLVFQQSL